MMLSFRQSIEVMVGMKVKACNDKYFGDALCTNQVAFTLTIMYPMDLVPFFLDTFLWWILRNVVFSITCSFFLGLSIWTPWREIYTQLLKRIYSKLLAIPDLGSSINQGLHSLGTSPPFSRLPFVSRSLCHRSGML